MSYVAVRSQGGCGSLIDRAMQSCRELKNFAGVSAIMDGLSQTSVQEQESAWQVYIHTPLTQ